MSARSYAEALYAHSCRAGWVGQIWATLHGQSRQLLDLTTVAATGAISNRHAAGIQTVPIDQIHDSEGRCADFDRAFHPLTAHTEDRWLSVAGAYLRGRDLPPVDLIQVGEVYFVRDGHHRISAAAALGQQEIDAVVTVWQVAAPPVRQERAVVMRPQQHRSWAFLSRRAWHSRADV
jgi:uncharacterized ParB-like nuclease family protein